MVAHALEDAPNECCGIIAGEDGRARRTPRRAPTATASSRRTSSASTASATIRAGAFSAIYHSHTASEAYPSPTDVRLAFWPEAYYILVSLADAKQPVVRAFRILDGEISEEEITPA